tara:strand:+ start:75 stop:737 length:663 start_codon:yes stop_codon:yes gene_type:complete
MKFNNEHSLYKKNGFIIIDNFLPDDLYKEIVDIFHKGEYEEIKQLINDRYELWNVNDKYFPSVDEKYIANFWGSSKVSHDLKVLNVYKEYIKPVIEFISDGKSGKGRHQATKYNKNGKDFLRAHIDDYMGYIGYVMHFQKETWKYDWGGLLQMSINDNIETILPQPNRLVIHNHSWGLPHWVTPVNNWSKEDRYTLTGFCIKNGIELPKTWISRKDYSIF